MLVTINVSLSRISRAPVTVRRYRSLGAYQNNYNKWLLTKEKHYWARDVENNCGKKYRLVSRMLKLASADNNAFDANYYVDMGCLSNYKDLEIIRLEDGNKVLDILGYLEVGFGYININYLMLKLIGVVVLVIYGVWYLLAVYMVVFPFNQPPVVYVEVY